MIFFVSMSERGAMSHHRYGWQSLLEKHLKVSYKFFAKNNLSNFKFIFIIIFNLLKLKPKLIIFINGEYNPFLFIFHIISFCSRTKVIFSWHDVTPHNDSIINYLYWIFSFINILFCTKVIIYNDFYKNTFLLNKKYIYLPLPPILVPNACSIHSSIKKKNGSLVFLGRIERYKGLDRILDCYLLPDLKSELRILYIIGNCSITYKYKELLKESDKVFFLGALTDIDAYKYLLLSDAIVMPYRHCSQSFNPYWAGLTKNALIISSEVERSLSIIQRPGVYMFSNSNQLLSLIDVKSELLPFCHKFYSYELGLDTLIKLCDE